MVKIKICGLKRLEDIEIVNKYRPDYIGFVFADSKRKVSPEFASQMKDNLDSNIISVGVFVGLLVLSVGDFFPDLRAALSCRPVCVDRFPPCVKHFLVVSYVNN